MSDPRASETSAGHETRDVSVRPIVAVTTAGAVAALLFAGAVWLLIDFSAARQARESPPANPLASTFARKEPPEPRLQTHPLLDLQALRTHEHELLASYAWVDPQAGIVRIPIEQAKQLIAQRGVGPVGGAK